MTTLYSGDYSYNPAPMQSMTRTSSNTETKAGHSSYKYPQAQVDSADHMRPLLPSLPIKISTSSTSPNLLEELKAIIEHKAQETKEFENVTWEDFEKLELDSERAHGLKYDYDGKLKKLIIQIPHSIHESGVSGIGYEILKSRMLVEQMSPNIAGQWSWFGGVSTWYENVKDGSFSADGTFTVRQQPIFHVEVAFSQRWENVCHKVAHILEDRTILGVLVMNIQEKPDWRSPKTKAVSGDIIDEEEWGRLAKESRNKYPFHPFRVKGHDWVGSIEVHVSLFPQSWKRTNFEPPKFYLKPQGAHGTASAHLDRHLQAMWKCVLRAVGGPEDSPPLQINWDYVRNQLLDGVYATAQYRYIGWCGKKKRKIDDLEEGPEEGSQHQVQYHQRRKSSKVPSASSSPSSSVSSSGPSPGPSFAPSSNPTWDPSFPYSSHQSFVGSSQGYVEHTEQVTHQQNRAPSQSSTWHSPSTHHLSSGRQPTSMRHPPSAQNLSSARQPSSQSSMRHPPSTQNPSSARQPSSQSSMRHPPSTQNLLQATSQSFLHPPSAQNPSSGRQTDATFTSQKPLWEFPNSKNASSSSSRHGTRSTSSRHPTN